MTPLTTVAQATRTVRVIRSPPGSQLDSERNRAFWRMISVSFMQVSDAHLQVHRRNRRRSASVTRLGSSATPPRRASSSSSSDTADASAPRPGIRANDDDYEPEERSAGNTPRPRSATCSRAISPAAARKHTSRKSKSPAPPGPSSSRASKQGDSDDSAGELTHAYNRGSIPIMIPIPHCICRGSGVHPHPNPRFAGDRPGGPLPSPSPICRGSGIIPIPGSHHDRGFRALLY
jgi:hypothetical protein